MSQCLITYFSVTGTTRKAALQLSLKYGGDLFEITPAKKYSIADLNWSDDLSRTSQEYQDESCRPVIARLPDVSFYEDVYIGYPIWWHQEPRLIDSLFDQLDLRGKKIHLFATSGGSRIENSRDHIEKLYPDLHIIDATLMKEEQLW